MNSTPLFTVFKNHTQKAPSSSNFPLVLDLPKIAPFETLAAGLGAYLSPEHLHLRIWKSCTKASYSGLIITTEHQRNLSL